MTDQPPALEQSASRAPALRPCRFCRVPVLRVQRGPGRPISLDAEPVPGGLFALDEASGRWTALVLGPREAAAYASLDVAPLAFEQHAPRCAGRRQRPRRHAELAA